MTPARFDGLPRRLLCGREVPVAIGLRARTLGLSLLDRDDAGAGLLIPHCAAVHTFGMRFALDVYFLDPDGAVLSSRRAVPARRFVAHRGAAAVLEVPAWMVGSAGERRMATPSCSLCAYEAHKEQLEGSAIAASGDSRPPRPSEVRPRRLMTVRQAVTAMRRPGREVLSGKGT